MVVLLFSGGVHWLFPAAAEVGGRRNDCLGSKKNAMNDDDGDDARVPVGTEAEREKGLNDEKPFSL